LRKVEYGWIPVDSITVPYERYWSRLSGDELEALKEVIRKRGPDFSLEHPITVNAERRRKRYVLRDGHNRLQAFRELGYRKIYAIIRIFDDDREALEDARWGSIEDNWHRGQRDPKQLIELVKKWTAGMELSEAVKTLTERGFSRSYAYQLVGITRNDQLYDKVIKGELTIHDAVKCLTVRQPEEKPGKGIISEKEAVSEPQKPTKTRRGRISAKKQRGGRPRKEQIPGLTAGLRDELMRAFKALGIEDESERTLLMSQAAEVLGDYPVKTQMEAVKRWRESGGSISFQEALERVKKEEAKEKVEEVSESIKAEEAEGVSEAPFQRVPLEIEEKSREERIRECAEYFKKYLRSLKIPEEEAAKIAEHEEMKRLYEEVGSSPLNFETLLYLAGWKKIMFDVFGLRGKAPSKARGLEKNVPKLVEELRKNLDLVKRKMELSELQKVEALGRLGKLLDAESKALPNGTLLLYSDLPIKLVKPSDIFLTMDFAKHLRLQEAMVNLIDNIGGYRRIMDAEERLQIAEVEPGVVGTGYHAHIAVPLCPSCRRPLTCAVCGAPVNCKCGWPSIKYGKARRVR